MPATYAITLAKSDVVNLYRKVQGPLRVAANFMYEEWDSLQSLSNFEVDWSTREITAPMDLDEDGNVASIVEGGYEAKPSSTNPVDATFTWANFNARFTISKVARWIDQQSKGAMIENQMKYQGKKKLLAVKRRLAQYSYGFPTAIQATVQANVASGTTLVVPITNLFGNTSVTDKNYIARFFKKGEWIAALNPTGPAIRQFGKITGVNPAGGSGYCELTVVFNAAVALTAGDYVCFAASLQEDTSTLDSCDYGKGLQGWLHLMLSDTVQNISATAYPGWAPSYSNVSAGRFTGIKLRRMKQAISNTGGGTLTDITWSQGVENDVVAGLQAGLRFTDAFGMEMDGSASAKGVRLKSTRSMIPGGVFGRDKSAVSKMVLLDPPGQPSWGDAEKIPDRAGFVLPLDYPANMVVTNRANLAYELNKDEQ